MERQMEELDQAARENQNAAQVLQQLVADGKLEFDENNEPNIIHNAGEQGNDSMSEPE